MSNKLLKLLGANKIGNKTETKNENSSSNKSNRSGGLMNVNLRVGLWIFGSLTNFK